MKIRLAKRTDAAALLAIYAPYVEGTAITFETSLPTVADFEKRIEQTLKNYPYLVAEEEGQILGYAYASAYYGRAAYAWSVEVSIYVSQTAVGQGIGSRLYDSLEEILEQQGYLRFLACIALPNDCSLALHKKRGYKRVAHFPKIGYKFDKWHDIVWLQKTLDKPLSQIKSLEDLSLK